ncbi:hypothetical protein ES705_47754 [subsurface metagenome]
MQHSGCHFGHTNFASCLEQFFLSCFKLYFRSFAFRDVSSNRYYIVLFFLAYEFQACLNEKRGPILAFVPALFDNVLLVFEFFYLFLPVGIVRHRHFYVLNGHHIQ